jgi:hypothetical protein
MQVKRIIKKLNKRCGIELDAADYSDTMHPLPWRPAQWMLP